MRIFQGKVTFMRWNFIRQTEIFFLFLESYQQKKNPLSFPQAYSEWTKKNRNKGNCEGGD